MILLATFHWWEKKSNLEPHEIIQVVTDLAIILVKECQTLVSSLFVLGSIPATGRIKASPSQNSVPMSAANSLQFNQLIGGAISPSVISSHQNGNGSNAGSRSTVNAGHTAPPQAVVASPNTHNQHSPAHLMIGDYVQGNMGGNVLTNSYRHQ